MNTIATISTKHLNMRSISNPNELFKRIFTFLLLIQIIGFQHVAVAESTFPAISPILSLLMQHPDITKQEASTFLTRATFGPTMEEINTLAASNNYKDWIAAQFAIPPSYHLEWVASRLPGLLWRDYPDVVDTARKDAWWDITVNGNDQLRQRVAFALSEIMVISQFGPLINSPDGLAGYYDILVTHAFGNFRDLLEDVTLSPMMGKYLSYLGNAKADPAKGNHPDENYAREVMQLFTIGLYQLNQDGSKITNPATGSALATYNQDDIREMAKVFTGWTDDNGFFFVGDGPITHFSRTAPMIAYEQYHDTSIKHILGTVLPAGQTTRQDLDSALDLLFNHPNVGPFIGRQLIQRLVTSNPSPDYISRVAGAFNNNGKGVRGDMKAVIEAVLLDSEAMKGAQSSPHIFGKVREPLLFISNLWRTYHAQNHLHTRGRSGEGEMEFEYLCFGFEAARSFLQQNAALESLTVFNYFTPEDSTTELRDVGLVSPEIAVMGIDGIHHIMLSFALEDYTYDTYELTASLDMAEDISLLENGQYDIFIEKLNLLFLAGGMTSNLKEVLREYIQENINETRYLVNGIPGTEKEFLARNILALVLISPEYAIQR